MINKKKRRRIINENEYKSIDLFFNIENEKKHGYNSDVCVCVPKVNNILHIGTLEPTQVCVCLFPSIYDYNFFFFPLIIIIIMIITNK